MFPVSERYASVPLKMHRSADILVNNVINSVCEQGCKARSIVQGGSNMTGTDLYVNKPHCAAAVRP